MNSEEINMPILSIVIANYNYGRFLEDAIKSIIGEKTNEIEIIICDGGSTDNSVEIIKKYESEIAWWVSEKDKGQSDAFNKGFSHAKGRFLTWLNADDIFYPGALSKILKEIKKHPSCKWFTGNFLRFTEDGKVVEIGYGPNWYPDMLQLHNAPLVVFGPSSFFAREEFLRIGGLDLNYHYAMDTDLWLKLQTSGVKQRRIRHICWAFRMHNASKTAEYEGRVLPVNISERIRMEVEEASRRLKYKASPILQILFYGLRILDGSLLTRLWLQIRLGRFNIERSI